MSRTLVRAEVEAEVAVWAAMVPISLVETINENGSVDQDEWLTVQYFSDETEPLCMGGQQKKESGTIDFLVFVKAGTGDARAGALCDSLQNHFETAAMPTVEITRVVPGTELNAGDASARNAGWIVSMSYSHIY